MLTQILQRTGEHLVLVIDVSTDGGWKKGVGRWSVVPAKQTRKGVRRSKGGGGDPGSLRDFPTDPEH